MCILNDQSKLKCQWQSYKQDTELTLLCYEGKAGTIYFFFLHWFNIPVKVLLQADFFIIIKHELGLVTFTLGLNLEFFFNIQNVSKHITLAVFA